MKVELTDEIGILTNTLAYPVKCCNGPVKVLQSSMWAGTEGRTTVQCPKCTTQWVVMVYFRQLKAADKAAESPRWCDVKGCTRLVKAKNLCRNHLVQLRSVGDPMAVA